MAKARDMRRYETQRNQRNAKTKLHPRGLARSVARFINRNSGQKENEINDFRETVIDFTRNQRPKQKPKRKIQRVS